MSWRTWLTSEGETLSPQVREGLIRFFASWEAFLFILLGTPISVAIGMSTEVRTLLPLFNMAIPYPLLLGGFLTGKRKRCIGMMLLWAICLGVSVTGMALLNDAWTGEMVLRGTSYRAEMLSWVRTGYGAESTPRLFIPEHLKHAALFIAATLLTGGTAGLFFGAILMNYMSYYVAGLVLHATDLTTVLLMGWPVWSIVRVASFIILGVVLSEPMLSWMLWEPYRKKGAKGWILLALFGLALDIVLKTWLAPLWSVVLRGVTSL